MVTIDSIMDAAASVVEYSDVVQSEVNTPNAAIEEAQCNLIESTDVGNAFELRKPGSLTAFVTATTASSASIQQVLPLPASATPAVSAQVEGILYDNPILVESQTRVSASVLDASSAKPEDDGDRHRRVTAAGAGISDGDIHNDSKLKVSTTKRCILSRWDATKDAFADGCYSLTLSGFLVLRPPARFPDVEDLEIPVLEHAPQAEERACRSRG